MVERHWRDIPPLLITNEVKQAVKPEDEAFAVSKMVQLSIRSDLTERKADASDLNSNIQVYQNYTEIPSFPVLSHSLTVPNFFPYPKRSPSLNVLECENYPNDTQDFPQHQITPVLQARRHSHHHLAPYSHDRERFPPPFPFHVQDTPIPVYQRHVVSESDIRTEWYDERSSYAQYANTPHNPEQDTPLDLSVSTTNLFNAPKQERLAVRAPDRRHSSSSLEIGPSGYGLIVSKQNRGYHGIESRLACMFCHEVFSSQDSLMTHLDAHYKPIFQGSCNKVHLCDVCKKTFARSDMLARHMRLHTGLKPYSCKTCCQVFSRSDHLATHMRTHTGEKPYKCPHCSYSACRKDMITRYFLHN